jgi:sulfite exporter TauE/SafE
MSGVDWKDLSNPWVWVIWFMDLFPTLIGVAIIWAVVHSTRRDGWTAGSKIAVVLASLWIVWFGWDAARNLMDPRFH